MSDLRSLLQQAQKVHLAQDTSQDSSVKKSASVSTSPPYVWTNEQEAFLNDDHPRLVLSALAGTGKTSLLMEYAKRRPHKKYNFLAFNRSVIQHWQHRCPKNVRLSTVHQLAMRQKGVALQHKIIEQSLDQHYLSWMQPYEAIMTSNKASPLVNISYHDIVKECLFRYLYQPNRLADVSIVSLWKELMLELSVSDQQVMTEYLLNYEEHILFDMKKVWRAMVDETNHLPITHDVYLKVFCLSSFQWEGHWMLDEAQDWSASFYQYFAQSSPSHIITGDPFQRLYQFRFAQKNWDVLPSQRQHWLTQSFRQGYGPEALVNHLLKKLHCPVIWKPVASFPCSMVHTEETTSNIQQFAPSVILAFDHERLRLFQDQHPSVNIPMMTIHASKGLEFEKVWVCDQALPPFVEKEQRTSLWYVATTRAQKALRLPVALSTILPHQPSSLLSTQALDWDDDF